MKSLIIFFKIFIFILSIYSQQPERNRFDVNFSTNVQQKAHYPGGDEAFFKYVLENIRFSKEALEIGVKKSATVSFYVEADSTVTDVSILEPIGFGIDEEIERIIKNTKFAPAIINGIKTKQRLMVTIPIRTPSKAPQ